MLLVNWHAAAVHLPIGLSLVWPLIDAMGLLTHQPAVSRTAIALMLTAMLTSLIATATGEIEYNQAVLAGFSEQKLHSHTDYGAMVPWALMAIAGLRLWLPGQLKRGGAWPAVVLGMACWWLIIHVGHTGGMLVYESGVGLRVTATGETATGEPRIPSRQ